MICLDALKLIIRDVPDVLFGPDTGRIRISGRPDIWQNQISGRIRISGRPDIRQNQISSEPDIRYIPINHILNIKTLTLKILEKSLNLSVRPPLP